MDQWNSDGLKRARAVIVHVDIVAMKAFGLSRSGGVDDEAVIGTIDPARGVIVKGVAYRIIEINGKRLPMATVWEDVRAAVDEEKEKTRGVALCVNEDDVLQLTTKQSANH